MKLVFFDIDGVLNSDTFLLKRFEDSGKGIKIPHPQCEFCPILVANLNKITDETGAKLVMTSSFRKTKTLEQLQEICKLVGITGELIAKTDNLVFQNWSYSVPRGCEIHKYFEDNKLELKVNDWVIIDDDSDMLYWHRNNFFHIDRECGLSKNMTYKIINFLK